VRFTQVKIMVAIMSGISMLSHSGVSMAQIDELHDKTVIPVINAMPLNAPPVKAAKPLRELSEPSIEQPQSPIIQSAPVRGELDVPLNESGMRSSQQSIISQSVVADLVEDVSLGVVNIIVTTDTGETTSEGQGSGFIITSDGEVVTNYHVIDGGTNIDIEFNNGEKYSAKILGTDPETDLALLKIQANRQFKSVSFYQGKKLRIGDWVVAIGNPFGIGQSTSLGVISAIGRKRVDSGAFVEYIQTDATINRGNSGGPLFNLNGDVVGVNSAIYSPTGASVGIAFVIPHKTAANVISSLRRSGRVQRGYLGAGLRTATFELDSRPGIYKAGATINNIAPGGPAEQYGLQIDDIILNINGQAVRSSVEATRVIAALRPGEIAHLIYERDEKTYTIDLSMGERPEKEEVERLSAVSQGLPAPAKKNKNKPRINIDTGLNILDLSPEFRKAIGMRPDQVGVYVESVTANSGAERGGFKTGMVLLEADGEQIAEVRKFKSIILNAKEANKSSILIMLRQKDGQETYYTLPL